MQVKLTKLPGDRYLAVNAGTDMEQAEGDSAVEAIAKLSLLINHQMIVVNNSEIEVSPDLDLLEDDIAAVL